MSKEQQRIKELEEKVAFLTQDPRAKLYAALVKGVDHITEKLESKELEFEKDAFAKSVLILAEKADKIFISLTKGLETFQPAGDSDTKKSGRQPKINGDAV